MIYRYTVEILASGQPRPYADHQSHVRLTIEVFHAWLGDPNDERSAWKPNETWKEPEVRELLKRLRCGFTERTAKDPEFQWFDTQLVSLTNPSPGVWEFRTTRAYTD